MSYSKIQREEIERQMKEKGIPFYFSGLSETNGLSIYYLVDGQKYRFSNHSTTNIDRVLNERHFGLPFVSTFGFGGIKRKKINVFTNEIIEI